MHKIKHKAFIHLNLRRSTSDDNNYLQYKISASFRIWSYHKKITDCLINNLLSLPAWLSVMVQMAEFVTYLHDHSQSLSTVIEDCVIINIEDIKDPKPLFFYCQPFAVLKHQFSQMSRQEQADGFK